MMDGLAAIQARMNNLAASIRTFDPSWNGGLLPMAPARGPGTAAASTAPGAGATAPAAPVAFSDVLDATATGATHIDAGIGAFAGGSLEAGPLTISGSASLAGLAGATPTKPSYGAGSTVAPVPGARISQDFGPTSFTGEPSATVDGVHYRHYHDGVDYAAPIGRPVRAIAAGEVVGAGRVADGAVIVRIRHADGSESLYGHLQADLDVKKGDRVASGEKIGRIGMTGHTTGPHLHLELTRDGRKLDPERWIDAGHLPGAKAISSATTPAAAAEAPSGSAALARFDEVAGHIPYAKEIRAAAVKAHIDPLLLASMVRAESGFRANAVSRVGAQGLAQLMPATSKSMGVKDPFDAATNVAAGARYLANNLRIYGRTDLALAAYQAGKGAVARAGGIPASPTTHHYIDRILGYWSGYLKEAAA